LASGGAYHAAIEEEIRKRGYSIASMLRAADAATTWDKDEAWDMVRAALERQLPKSSS
jgi:predicted fused transcriptional regulator/phosphomethylpyrimidine kinase